ncbi:MAG: M23 family metallopeptidase [Helicobacteraceae bacterium]|nr:M23 family metallopeptidase [Helicobacteraceae bacterium]
MKKAHGGFIKILGLVVIVIVVGLGIVMLTFEKNAPSIEATQKVWNLKDNLSFKISDDSPIKSYSVFLLANGQRIPLEAISQDSSECGGGEKNSICIGVKKPQNIKSNTKLLSFEVVATDSSKWNFFSGNTAKEQFDIIVDIKRPEVAIVGNSYKITKGGSALVIFRAVDENLDSITINNGNLDFKAMPFYKDGYFISLLAWSKLNDNFSAKIIAKDSAGNVSITPIPYFLQNREYKTSTIPLTDKFIDGKISSLVEEIGEKSLSDFENKVDIFKYINEEIRDYSFNRIFSVANKIDDSDFINDFKISPFSPLRNGAVMANFGDFRSFSYEGEIVSTSNHMGLDLASIKQAPVLLSNAGVVTLNEFVGIDGNTLVINHGLGLSSLYAHLTSVNVSVGDSVSSGIILANTGATGLALGDHLHFGILVQGYEVRVAEWMDSQWIKLNIIDVINSAKEVIDRI